MSWSLSVTCMAIFTVSSLLRRMKAMVSNHPLRKLRTSSGLAAISLSVAKITWIWKSLMSVKRTRMRPSPFFSSSKALPMSMVVPAGALGLGAGVVARHRTLRRDVDAVGAPALPARGLADEPIGQRAGSRDADGLALELDDGLGPVRPHHDREQERGAGHGG